MRLSVSMRRVIAGNIRRAAQIRAALQVAAGCGLGLKVFGGGWPKQEIDDYQQQNEVHQGLGQRMECADADMEGQPGD